MAGASNVIKYFRNDKGLDQRSSDLNRSPEFASAILNSDFRKTGALNKRKGSQSKHSTTGGSGTSIFANINLDTGDITEELVVVDANLHKLVSSTFTVTYTGAGEARMSMLLDGDTSKFYFEIIEDEVILLTADLGTGINEASSTSLSSLKTQIDALTDFSASIAGVTTSPAAFLDITNEIVINSSGVAINYTQLIQINSSISDPLATSQTFINSSSYQNASIVNLGNVLYVSTGYDFLQKYDGQTFYRAGMPTGVLPSNVTSSGTSTITNSDLKYIQTYVQIDNKNNTVEGIPSAASTGINVTNVAQIDVDATHIADTSGFNTNCGIVAGLQTTVTTLTLDDGSGGNHTFNSGDTAYFYDSVTGDYITRTITSTTTSTIVISGAAVTVADNAVISNNLRIALYRNQSAGTTYSLVAEIPNDSFTGSAITYNDTTLDANLGADYVAPIKPHGLPPNGKYLTVFQNKLIISGDNENVNTVYYSDELPEYFPALDNQFDVDTELGDKVSGLASNQSALFAFKDRSIHALTGELFNDQYRVDRLQGGDVGCTSHHTIAEIKGKLFFLGKKGVFSIKIGDIEPEEVSYNIEPIFRDFLFPYNFEKAVAINWFQKDKYILFLPIEGTSIGGDQYTDIGDSQIVVYDYAREAWLPWKSLDLQGGAAILGDTLYFSERRLGTVSANVESNLYQILDNNDIYDYADHSDPISFEWASHWETMSEPDIYKKFLRLKMHSLDSSINNFESQSFTVDVETQIDYNNTPSSSYTLDYTGDAGWGYFSWGIDGWGSVRKLKDKFKLKFTKALSLRVIFKNSNIHENILISGWTFEVSTPYLTRVKE
jgi:hypothetical protein